MNIRTRKNFIYRLVCGITLLLSAIGMVFTLVGVLLVPDETKPLPVIAVGLTILFVVAEAIFILKGKKKEIVIKDIAFNENNKLNNVFLIPVIVGAIFGIALLVICTIVYLTKEGDPYFTSSLVIISIATFLLENCIFYFIYIIMFRKRKLDIKDFAK